MVSKLNVILFTTLIAGTVLALSSLNREPVLFTIFPGMTYSASLGVVAICLLLVGIVCGGCIGAYYGLKSYFSNSRLLKKEREEKESVSLLLSARTALATKDFGKARSLLEKLTRRSNYSLLASVELTKVIQAQGDIETALIMIDNLRKSFPDEFEVLLRSAEIHEASGNKTAALDALSLILLKYQNEYVAKMARDISYSLERYDDALAYQEKLELVTRTKEDTKANILYKILERDAAGTIDKFEQGVRNILKSYPRFVPALEFLAHREIEKGNTEKAAALLLKRAETTHLPAHWDELRKLWLSNGSPERALSAANIALREAGEGNIIEVELARARLLIGLSMNEEAEKNLAIVEKTPNLTPELSQRIRLLKVVLGLPGGAAREEILAIIDGKKPLVLVQKPAVETKTSKIAEPPPARLSTP